LALVAVAGCSNEDKKLTIQGTISYKGQPVRSGFLKFVGPKEGYTGASIQPDGTFVITGVVPGENKIGVREAPRNSRPSPDEPKTPPVVLPEKFRDPETSGVVYTIAPNATEVTIELK
jgi:hypothetical protein